MEVWVKVPEPPDSDIVILKSEFRRRGRSDVAKAGRPSMAVRCSIQLVWKPNHPDQIPNPTNLRSCFL